MYHYISFKYKIQNAKKKKKIASLVQMVSLCRAICLLSFIDFSASAAEASS